MEIITTHINADFDGIGSMIGIKKLYPQAVMLFLGSQEESVNKIANKLWDNIKFYRLRDLKIENLTKVILVDTRSPKRLGGLEDYIDKYKPEIHIYDHHAFQNGDYEGDKVFYEDVGSTTTIICKILERENITLTGEEATYMLAGIYEDTGMLTYTSTKIDDYLACAWLLKNGANLKVVKELIARDISRMQIGLLNEMLNELKIYSIYGYDIGITMVSSEEFIGDFAVLVQKIKDMENLPVIFGIGSFGDRIFISARSRIKEINVADILSAFNGGGHSYAASATVKNLTIFQVKEKLLEELRNRIERPKVARDIMSLPVKYVEPETKICEAKDILTKYNINMVPVCEIQADKPKIIGLISRQNVEKAAFHGYENYPVKNFMTTEFFSVRPDSELKEIRELIFRGRQRLLPVVNDEGVPVGVVTRTDFLRIIQDEKVQGILTDDEKREEFNKNLKHLMEVLFDKTTLDRLIKVGEIASSLGYNAFIVGGVVRDLILRKLNYDIDIVVEGDSLKLVQNFAKLRDVKITEHRKFGTARLTFKDGKTIDVATARIEYYPSPASLPTIESGSLKLDLYRRDFTINTLAIKLNPSSFGELIDYFGGLRDIKEGIIRVLHNLSFVEDPTRILRALRFEVRFNFKISKHTMYLIKNAIKMDIFRLISGSRLFTELELIFQEDEPHKILDKIDQLGIIGYIHKDINWKKIRPLFLKSMEVMRWYELLYTSVKINKNLVYLLCLFHKLSYEETKTVLKNMSVQGQIYKAILDTKKREHSIEASLEKMKEIYEVYFLLKDLSIECGLYFMAKSGNENIRKAISLYFTELWKIKTYITGEDLKALGYEPSPMFSKIFQELLKERIKGNIKTKDDEIEWVKKLFPLQKFKKNVK